MEMIKKHTNRASNTTDRSPRNNFFHFISVPIRIKPDVIINFICDELVCIFSIESFLSANEIHPYNG
jgi:hypothetical protein